MEQQALRIWNLFISEPSLWDGWDISSTPVGFHNDSMAVLLGHPEPPSKFSTREAEGVRHHVALPKTVSLTANKSIELNGVPTATVIWNTQDEEAIVGTGVSRDFTCFSVGLPLSMGSIPLAKALSKSS